MNDERLLREALDHVVPPRNEFEEWDDVLRRAGGESRRMLRPALLLGLLLLALVVAVVATPARSFVFDLIGRHDRTFSSGAAAPVVVKRQFDMMTLGPPSIVPGVLPSQARLAGMVHLVGKPRRLWVAPTSHGGFCFVFAHVGGSCYDPRRNSDRVMGVGYLSSDKDGAIPSSLWGELRSPRAARLTVEFEGGTTHELGFIYVSAPIEAGFFGYDVPAANQAVGHRPRTLVLRDEKGNEIAREPIGPERNSPPTRPTPHRPTPLLTPTPAPAPTPPLQHGTAGGVTVTAGHNGAARFDLTAIQPRVQQLLSHSLSFGCFRLERRYGRLEHIGPNFSGALAEHLTMRPWGVETPYDGCEIQGGYGRRWPDRNGSHAPVEIAFTDAGRAYFADRAAARNLALFVRSPLAKRIRSGNNEPIPTPPNQGSIRYTVAGDTFTFTTTSPTGRRFSVQVRDEHIVTQNLLPYTFAVLIRDAP